MTDPRTDIKLFISAEQLLDLAKAHLAKCGITLDGCRVADLGTYFSGTDVKPSWDGGDNSYEGQKEAIAEGHSLNGVVVTIGIGTPEGT